VYVDVGITVFVLVCVDVTVLVHVLVAVRVLVGVGVAGCGIICIASTFAFSTLDTNCITIVPPLGLILLNTLSTAMFCPPAAAYMSKLLNTWLPFIVTLNTLAPALVWNVSANLSVTWYVPAGTLKVYVNDVPYLSV
jgi:hypothetical protein